MEHSVVFKIRQNAFPAGALLRITLGSSGHSPRPPSRLGGDTPPHTPPSGQATCAPPRNPARFMAGMYGHRHLWPAYAVTSGYTLLPVSQSVEHQSTWIIIIIITRNAFCGTWYLPHSHVQVHNERTVPIIMAGCIAHARNGRISTSGKKSDVTIVFLDPDFLNDVKILAIRP